MPIAEEFEITTNGDAAVDIRFHAAPSAQLSEIIIALAAAIDRANIPAVTEVVPAYQCLTVCFDPLALPLTPQPAAVPSVLQETLAALVDKTLTEGVAHTGERYLIRIPVCYDEDYAPDMPTLCAQSGLSAEEIIARHTAPAYLVHMLGFTPGFLYLGGLDRQLHCPRKARPELQVPAGSVGIGGSQTGIYPQATPGGWQILGRTPLALFRPEQDPPVIARPLDRIQFVPISPQAFAQMDPLAEPEKTPLSPDAASSAHSVFQATP